MAFLFGDGMSGYSDSTAGRTDLQEAGWIVGGVPNYILGDIDGGRFGAGSFVITNNNGYLSRAINIAVSTLMVQAAFKLEYGGSDNRDFLNFYNNGGADSVCSIRAQYDGSLRVYNSGGSLVATSSSGVLWPGSYQYLEVKVVSNNATGSVLVKLNEVTVINATNIDTSITATDIDLVRFCSGNTSNSCWWDDIIFLDDSGPAPHNDLIGDVRARELLPSADTATADWDRNTGATDYGCVDDAIPGDHDGDTTYIYDDTVGGKSLFDFGNMSDTPAYIYGVIAMVAAKKSDAGGKTMRAYLDSGGTVSNGDTWSIGTSYQTWRHIWSLDPNGSIAWAKAAVDALQAGVEVVS